uniref:NADH dehydrogenase subunit 1 n=1 Tax=Romanomermis culicivorax TaxID=13658 RepID=A0A915KWJ2_ROMCU
MIRLLKLLSMTFHFLLLSSVAAFTMMWKKASTVPFNLCSCIINS